MRIEEDFFFYVTPQPKGYWSVKQNAHKLLKHQAVALIRAKRPRPFRQKAVLQDALPRHLLRITENAFTIYPTAAFSRTAVSQIWVSYSSRT